MDRGIVEVLGVAVFVALAGTIVAAIIFRPRSDERPGPDPRAVLADRLARGEISREEFDTAMRALGIVPWQGPGPSAPMGGD